MASVQMDRAVEEAKIRSLIERRVQAVQDKDVATVTSDQAKIVLFDAVPPLQSIGLDAERRRTHVVDGRKAFR